MPSDPVFPVPPDHGSKQSAQVALTNYPSQTEKVKAPRAAEADTDEFPEGGRGWLVVAATFTLMGLSFGMASAYGEYQSYYLAHYPTTSQSILTLVGSLQPFIVYACAIPATLFIRRVGAQTAVAISGATLVFSLMMTSLSKSIWQLALAQGVLFGLGSSISVFVSYTVPQQWFKKKRAAAIGIVASGSSIGGLLWPIALNRLFKNVGFPWANRIIGFIYIPFYVFAVLAIKTREHEMNRQDNDPLEPMSEIGPAIEAAEDIQHDIQHVSSRPASIHRSHVDADEEATIESKEEIARLDDSSLTEKEPSTQDDSESQKHWLRRHIFHRHFLIDWSVLLDWHYLLVIIANAIGFFGLFPPLFFISSFAQNLNVSPNIQTYIITISNSGSVLGRIAPGFIGDRIGRLNMLIVAVSFSGIVMLGFWLPAKGAALLILAGFGYGMCSGALVSLAPAVLGQLFGINGLQSRLSIFFLVCSPGSLVGPIISGAFLPTGGTVEENLDGYKKIAIFVGVFYLVSAAILCFARFSINPKLWVFV